MRQPHNVCVLPFSLAEPGPRYAIFQRSDDGTWQPVAGGVEQDEDLAMAARRETEEEAGVAGHHPLYRLDMVSGVGKDDFAASRLWPQSLYIVVKHYFAIDVSSGAHSIRLSPEHAGFTWASYAEAHEALRYDDDKNALWELDARLRNGDLPAPAP